MAKKSRRERRLAGQSAPKAPSAAIGAAGGITAPVAPGRQPASQEMPRRMALRPQRTAGAAQRTPINFEREHALVKHDLRRISMVGGSLAVILVVLSFFIK